MRTVIISISIIFNVLSVILLTAAFLFRSMASPSVDSVSSALGKVESSPVVQKRPAQPETPRPLPPVTVQVEPAFLTKEKEPNAPKTASIEQNDPHPNPSTALDTVQFEEELELPSSTVHEPQANSAIGANHDQPDMPETTKDLDSRKQPPDDISDPAQEPEQDLEILLSTIGGDVFLPGRDVLKPADVKQLRNLLGIIKNSLPAYQILIEGHTDDIPIRNPRGSRIQNNLQLSQLRAEAVSSVLLDAGIPARHVITKGYGATRPLTSNATAAGRERNRRVEIRLVPADDSAGQD